MSQSALQRLPIEQLFASPQVRTERDQNSLTELAASIKQVGILQPIHVRPPVEGRFEILFGDRRWTAAKLAGLTHVPVIVDSRAQTDAAVVQVQLTENLVREDIPAFDKAQGIRRLMQLSGSNASDVAQKLGLSNSTVSNLLSLLTLPEPVQQQVRSGTVPVSTAYELARISDPDQQTQLAEQFAAGTLNRGGLARAAKAHRPEPTAPVAPALTRAKAVLTGGPSVTVAGPELTLESFIGALEEVLSKARRVRSRGVELATFVRMLRDEVKTHRNGK